MWTNEQIRWAWQQAITVEGYDPNMVRKDACGAWIVWGKYGHQDSPFGWEVDHIFPKDKGGDERPINLRAMQHANNAAKGNDYPSYQTAMTSNGERNIENRKMIIVSPALQQELKKNYPNA